MVLRQIHRNLSITVIKGTDHKHRNRWVTMLSRLNTNLHSETFVCIEIVIVIADCFRQGNTTLRCILWNYCWLDLLLAILGRVTLITGGLKYKLHCTPFTEVLHQSMIMSKQKLMTVVFKITVIVSPKIFIKSVIFLQKIYNDPFLVLSFFSFCFIDVYFGFGS